MIEVQGLTKTFFVPIKGEGLVGSIRALWSRKQRAVEAVRNISFSIQPGERVGFLGPNGAGKTTTLKMLAGLLHPTSGQCRVLGKVPQQREAALLQQITLVMGQKQQLLWDLPARETFELNRALFGVDRTAFRRNMDELVAMLALDTVIDKPVRNLSLGERMKCELVAALVHRPSILFLDEPTIGLDVTMQAQVRNFILDCNQRFGATILLTSHYMQDIEAITPRLLIIDKGQIRYDGSRDQLSRTVAPERKIVVKSVLPALLSLGFVENEGKMVATVPAAEANGRIAQLLNLAPLAEFDVEAPPLEEVIARVFEGEAL
jgi:ABC-2 type transport system ATP-binding protein